MYIKYIQQQKPTQNPQLASDCFSFQNSDEHFRRNWERKPQAQLTDCVDRRAVRQQAKGVVEDAAAMEDGGRESQQTGEEVLQFAKLGAFGIRQLGVDVVLAE